MLSYQHRAPEYRVYCGPAALRGLTAELTRADASRVVLICTRSLVREDRALAQIKLAIGGRLVGQFSDVRRHSPLPSVEAAAWFLEEVSADAIVVVGGGSAIVTARAAGVLFAERKPLRDLCTFRDGDGELVSPKLLAPKAPQFVIPSTPTLAFAKAGSGVHDPATGQRLALFDPKARPRGLFFDPAVAGTAPTELWESASLNMFAGAVEALHGDWDNPIAEASLRHGISKVMTSLPALGAGADESSARLELMSAALLCGIGTDPAGGSLAQALAHAIGPRAHASHGMVEAAVLRHTLDFDASAPGRFGRLAEAMGASAPANPTEDALRLVRSFLDGAGVPRRLRELGIAEDQIGRIALLATDDWAFRRLPRPIDEHGLRVLLQEAW